MNSILQEVVWQEVDSSNIRAIAYHEDSGQILVRFKDGATWSYPDCDEQLYGQFKEAPSVGKFFHSNIKPKGGESVR